MDDAVRARDAASEALADIEPERLREVLDRRIADAAMTPAALTLASARALAPDVDVEQGLLERAAGVQLIYEGLRLTRQLTRDEPWARLPDAMLDAESGVDADIDILAADVLVARGFYLLARSEAAERAVNTVRSFGRDQTRRREAPDPASLDRNLEADVFDLAVTAGATSVGVDTPQPLREFAGDLAREYGTDVPPPSQALFEELDDRLSGGDRVPSSADS